MNRTNARDAAFKIIFSYETQKENADYLLDLYFGQALDTEGQQEYIQGVVRGALEHLEIVDGYIVKYAEGWQLNRISRVSLAAMRTCLSELLYGDVPSKVALNEAVELAKMYEGKKAATFVNGVLASVMEELGKTE